MEYTIQSLVKLAGISARTLRYYEEYDLLAPKRKSNGYRIYGRQEVDRLQQILFYRALDMPLEEIRTLLNAKTYDTHAALMGHLDALRQRRDQLECLIANVEQTLASMKGEQSMSDSQKFKGFTRRMVDENEARYGVEARARYGDAAVNRANEKLRGMNAAQVEALEQLSQRMEDTLRAAFAQGDPAAPLAQEACDLHRQWLQYYWDSYTPQAHMGLAQAYVDDPRFTAHYDRIAPGCARFLRDAMRIYCREA